MTRDDKSSFRCVRLAAVALALGIFSSAGIAGVGAQDASPVASPAAVACDSPGLPPGTPTPMDDMSGMEMASPEAEMGTPIAVAEAEEDVPGAPADEATAATVYALIENYAACYTQGQTTGDAGLYVALESTNYVESQGYATRYDRAAGEVGSPFTTAQVLSVSNAMTWEDGRVSADAEILVGPYWYNHWRIFFAEEDGAWLYDQEANLPPTPDTDFVAVNGLTISEVADETTGETAVGFQALSGSWDFAASDAIIFNLSSSVTDDYDVAIVQAPEGVDPAGLADGSVDFSELTFIAFGTVPAEGTADVTLLGLPAGAYTLLGLANDDTTILVQPFNVVAAS